MLATYTPPAPPPLNIRAAADGLCLTTGPLRFTACAGADLWAAEPSGSVLKLQSGAVKLWQPLSDTGEAPARLCVDQQCLRCIHRGNGNLGSTGWCFKGHELVCLRPWGLGLGCSIRALRDAATPLLSLPLTQLAPHPSPCSPACPNSPFRSSARPPTTCSRPQVHAAALSSGYSAAGVPPGILACLVLAALLIGSRLFKGKPPTQPSRRPKPTADGATAAALQASRDQARQLRLHLRSSRDEARPVRLLHMMLAGEKFNEIDDEGRAHSVWLEISPDQLRLRAFKTKTASVALECPLYELELSALRKISFGQSAHPAAHSTQQKSSFPSSFPRVAPSQYTQTPWRCFAVDAGSAVAGAEGGQEPGEHFFVGQQDNSAITWVQGLQSLLHASGQLEQPLPPAKLLWLRARMRLLQRAVRHKSPAGATLAAVVRGAMRKPATTRRG